MELLARLCDAPGVSGCEDKVREIISSEIGHLAESTFTDYLGNLYMTQGQTRKGPHLMFAAHTDEVGLMVHEIDEEGYVKFMAVGGVDPRVLPGKRVRMGSDAIPGVIAVPSYHLTNSNDRKDITPISKLRIDIGATSRSQAEKYIEPGTPIWFDTRTEITGDIIKAKAFDDRAGCYMMAELIKHQFDMPVTFVWTVQEEVGLRGAAIAAARVRPDILLVLEGTGACDVPVANKDTARNPYLGNGPVITILDWSVVAHPRLVNHLTSTGDSQNIPWQYKRPLVGGTDAGAAIRVKPMAAAILAIPARYIHSPVAYASTNDIINTIELVKASAHGLKEVLD